MGAKLDKALALSLLVLLVLTTLLYGAVEPWATFILEIFVALLVVLWASQVAAAGHVELFIPPTLYPLLAFLLLGALHSFTWVDTAGVRHGLSADPEASQLTLLMLFLFCVAFLLFANFLVTPERLNPLVTFLIIWGFLIALFGLVQHFTWNGKYYWVHEKFIKGFGPFHNHSHFSGYLEMIVPFAVAILLLREKKTEKRTLYGLAATTMGVAIVISLSRGGMLSLTASLLLVILLSVTNLVQRRRHAEQTARAPMNWLAQAGAGAIVILAILAGIFWLGADSVVERVTGRPETAKMSVGDKLLDARGSVWQEGLTIFKANPLTGVGLGAYQTVQPTYTSFDSGVMINAEAHNDYLQVLTDTGLVGGILLVWFLVLLVRDVQRGLQNPDPRLAVLALGCGGGIFALLIHSFFDFNLQIPSNALLFLLLTAFAARLSHLASTNGRRRVVTAGPPPRARRSEPSRRFEEQFPQVR